MSRASAIGPAIAASVATLREHGVLSELDDHFAQAIARLAGERDERVLLAAALVSCKVKAGHVCIDLARLGREETVLETDAGRIGVSWPEPSAWLTALRASTLVGSEAEQSPLYVDPGGRLYLRRYFEHEQRLAHAIRERAKLGAEGLDRKLLQEGLDRLFGAPSPPPSPARKASAAPRAQLDLFAPPSSQPEVEPDGQRLAAERALTRAFCVISGGPGTGKTSTVVKILALLLEQSLARKQPPPRMLLLAPTGKAAARLSQAIKHNKGKLALRPEVLAAIPDEASTIHRALGVIGGPAQRFRHHQDAPLAADVVVVDEASMVDLALMSRLLLAIPRGARVILLGDKDQLASVEAGAVLGDICGAGLAADAARAPIADGIALLTRSYRYAESSGIRALAEAINASQADRALVLLRDPGVPDVTLVEPTAQGTFAALEAAAVQGFAPLLAAADAPAKLEALERFAVLCAHRRGDHGQLAINARIESALRDAGLIGAGRQRYAGRPVMVTQNDYQARLFNGEVGVLLRDPAEPSRMLACFLASDGRVRQLAAARLPPHESAFALSVHKSQGSEWDDVLVVLPAEPSPVLSRELLYTAVTRARRRVVIYGSAEIVALTVGKAVQRTSGLRDALWGAGG